MRPKLYVFEILNERFPSQFLRFETLNGQN